MRLVTSHKLGNINLGLDFVLQHRVEIRWWDDSGRGFVYIRGNRLPCKITHKGKHQPPDVGLNSPGCFIPFQYYFSSCIAVFAIYTYVSLIIFACIKIQSEKVLFMKASSENYE